MNFDFTITKYNNLCLAIVDSEYNAVTVEQYLSCHPSNKPLVILRHDVDRKVKNALMMAEIENRFGINSTYYFRTIKKVFKAELIKKIEKMGHEIGYHYEVLETAKGDCEKAIELFKEELEEFRRICEIKTICMHGNPLSKWTNRELWEKYNFEEFGIIGEAYISIDFNNVAYFTDTGRAWSNKCNLKDCVEIENPYLDGVKIRMILKS